MLNFVIESYRGLFLIIANYFGYGLGVMVLSIITSLLMLPLMKFVLRAVNREKDYQSVIAPQLKNITEKYAEGHERHLRIESLYDKYGYNQVYAVRKVLPLFLTLPFLLLTYYMLKGTTELAGVPFMFVRDWGASDGLLRGINLLPFAMTLVNLLAAFTMPGFSKRDLAQAAGISVLFLFLLYNAPAALLIYWTFINLITLMRNLFALYKRGMLSVWKTDGRYSLRTIMASVRIGLRFADQHLALFILSAILVSVYSMAVFLYQGTGSISGRVAINISLFVMNFTSLLCIRLLFSTRKKWMQKIKRHLAFSIIALFILVLLFHVVLILDIVFVRSMILYGLRFNILKYLTIVPYVFCSIILFGAMLFSEKNTERLRLVDHYPFLWIVILAIHYMTANSSIEPTVGSYLHLIWLLIWPVYVLYFLLFVLLGKFVKRSLLMLMLVATFVAFYSVPLYSENQGFWLLQIVL